MSRSLATVGAASVCLLTATTACNLVWGFQDATGSPAGGTDAGADADASSIDAASSADGSVHDVGPAGDALKPIQPEAAPPQDAPSALMCMPPCAGGFECQRAVSGGPGGPGGVGGVGAAVCVDAVASCVESRDCPVSSCCVWLDRDSRSGRCQAAGAAAPPSSCLCVEPMPGPKEKNCQRCSPPPGALPGTVMVCSP
jgi:hypothetical protein